jgi:hypothetical protein
MSRCPLTMNSLRFASPPGTAWLSSTRQVLAAPANWWKKYAAPRPEKPPPTTTKSYTSPVDAASAVLPLHWPSRMACAAETTSQVLPFERAKSPTPA